MASGVSLGGAPWQFISRGKFALFVGASLMLVLLIRKSPEGFLPLIDHANLLFHEAGHPFYGLFSRRLEPYGGTLGQLTFPLILAGSFWRKGQPLSFAASLLWFFENWLNIARYMADARKLQLPLVGGGDHDWNTIFSRWNVLRYDDRIASGVHLGGWLGLGLVALWVCWRLYAQGNEAPQTAGAEDEFTRLMRMD